MTEATDVVVVGGGQGGLATSYLLGRAVVGHVGRERGEIGESWRAQRWDSFHLNTPNWSNALPGAPFHPDVPDAFGTRDDILTFLRQYARTAELPVRERAAVDAVVPRAGGGYAVRVNGGTVHARAVVLASGAMNRPQVPAVAQGLANDVVTLSAGTYKNPESLPPGGVVVVGSGQSGCQIAEDLLEAGRAVYVSVSRVGRVPRTYRGRDMLAWWRDMGFFDVRLEELENPAMQFAAQPQVSGTAGGHTVSLQSLARDGATLLGRVTAADGYLVRLGADLPDSIAFADMKAQDFRNAVDAYIARAGIDASAPAPDPGEPPLPDPGKAAAWDVLDLQDVGVTSVVWCTGFSADWSWVKANVFDERGRPVHDGGVTAERGLYFVGLPWLSKRKSGILYGVGEDAERIVRHIERHVLGRSGSAA
jgi:putative flavoprotein involved in K+ transport